MASIKEKQYATLAIIPARGGSKSIPHKNIYPLGRRPLINYAIKAALKSRYVDRVIVTTDDAEIAGVAKRCGAEIPFLRPRELAKDSTPTIPVILHALSWLERNEGFKPAYVLLVEPTAPFVSAKQIDEAFRLMISKKADSATTVIRVPRVFHPYHVRRVDTKGFLVFDRPNFHYRHPTRQSDPDRFAHGNLWWFKRDLFLKKKQIEVGKRIGLEIDMLSAHDINTKSDLALADFLLKKRLL